MPSFVRAGLLSSLFLLVGCEKHVDGEACMEVAGTTTCRSYESLNTTELFEACGADIVEITGEGTYVDDGSGEYPLCCYPVQVVDGSCDDEE